VCAKDSKPIVRLRIRDPKHLYIHLVTSKDELDSILQHIDRHYYRNSIERKGKIRDLYVPIGRLRQILDNLQGLLQRIDLPSFIHGGRRGYSIFSNAADHRNKPMLVSFDIKDFFPSVSHRMVYEMFNKHQECSPDVARVLTRLVTYEGHLPQGSPTSTIVACLVVERLSKRLNGLARSHAGSYSQFVDDGTMSGPKHLCRLIRTIQAIVSQEGFNLNNKKTKVMNSRREQVVTGIRVNSGFDAPSEKVKEVELLLSDLQSRIDAGLSISKKAMLSLEGKIRFIGRLNPGIAKHMMKNLYLLSGVTPADKIPSH
jgi:RNA-directed DNA polymerase